MIRTILASSAFAAFAAYGMVYALSIPDVMVSYETRQCVEVINYSDSTNYSCENMPSKYNHVWVK